MRSQERFSARACQQVVADAAVGAVHQHRVERRGLVAHEGRRCHQPFDQLDALVGFGRFDEARFSSTRGNPADEVERQPADQSGVVGGAGRCDAVLTKPGVEVMIDDLFDGLVGRQQLVGRDEGPGGEESEKRENQAQRPHRRFLAFGVVSDSAGLVSTRRESLRRREGDSRRAVQAGSNSPYCAAFAADLQVSLGQPGALFSAPRFRVSPLALFRHIDSPICLGGSS